MTHYAAAHRGRTPTKIVVATASRSSVAIAIDEHVLERQESQRVSALARPEPLIDVGGTERLHVDVDVPSATVDDHSNMIVARRDCGDPGRVGRIAMAAT